jgi:hypothetical protein
MGLMDSYKRWKKIVLALKSNEKRFELIETNFNTLFFNQYVELSENVDYKTLLRSKEYKVLAQNGDDGLIAFIFSQIGTTNKTFIEFGIGNGSECNMANFIQSFGWNGLLIDGNKAGVSSARKLYAEEIKKGTVKIDLQFLTTENINQVFTDNGTTGDIDLLSIDIDGNDYWVWESISVVNPRVVVVEYNASFGNRSVTVPYQSDFYRFDKHKSGWYHGVSVKALEHLANAKGYDLVGCNSDGVNAFFVRKDISKNFLQKMTSEDAYYPARKRNKVASLDEQFKLISKLPLVEIK